MQRFLITTTHRHSRIGEPSGYLHTIDLDSRRATGQCPILEPPHLDADPNPRGGMRGAKGIAICEDELWVANASVVYRFDPTWNCLGTVSHPSCAIIHDIVVRDGTLWVSSCSNDLVLQFDLAGRILRHLNFRSYPEVRQALNWHPTNRLPPPDVLAGTIDFRDPRTHSHETYNGGHVNSLCLLPNGDLLVLLGLIRSRRWNSLLIVKNYLVGWGLWKTMLRILRPAVLLLPLQRVPRSDVGASVTSADSAVLRVKPDGSVSLAWVLPRRRVPTHSLSPLPDGTVLLNDTTDGCLVHLDLDQRTVLSRIKVTDEFLRGVCPLPENRALVGSQRDVLLVDLRKQVVLDQIRLSENPNLSVYDIKPLPPAFDELPDQLCEEALPEALVP